MTPFIIPTHTLAKLYESQGHYVPALVIYEKLHDENPSDEYKQKIKALHDLIFEKNRDEYDKRITAMFDQEELRYFKIFPHKQYMEYKDIAQNEEIRFMESPEKELDHQASLEKFVSVLKTLDSNTLQASLQDYFGSDKKIADITIADFIKAVENLSNDEED